MPSKVYWIAYGDIHSSTAILKSIPDLADAAGTIISGDLTFSGGRTSAAKVLDACQSYNKVVAAQIGNMDLPEVSGLLDELGINLHGKAIALSKEITLIGLGGSTPTPFDTPSEYTEEECALKLEAALAAAGSYKNLILVSHTPPHGTKCDQLCNGVHVGSTSVRSFIEKVQPDLCFCGHIHEARGIDYIGKTMVINSGTLIDGGYIKFYLDDSKKLVAELKQA